MLNQQQKIELLSYCMDDGEYSALRELELLPLANNTFLHFDQPSFTGDNVYLCTSEFPSLLFPSLEDCLIDVVSDDYLQSHFVDLVKSGCTQVIEVTMQSIAYLLKEEVRAPLEHYIHHHPYSMIKALSFVADLTFCNSLGLTSIPLSQSLVRYTEKTLMNRSEKSSTQEN